ncbi:MAG: MBL fold metallo-hydrolase [Proteobacteria bacterium]|nr:MBL fold metallo-hydrolase [Pseudomonadota bacterium]
MDVTPFYHSTTNSWSYVLADPDARVCALIDPVLDFELSAGWVHTTFVDDMLASIEAAGLQVLWVLETHIHADHISAADYVRRQTGAKVGIGAGVEQVSELFRGVFNLGSAHPDVGSAFDQLFMPGETLTLGSLTLTVLATPGHTPACVAYQVDQAVFVGDTLFMPDYGTARADFPGGDAAELYRSIQRLLALPDDTVLYLCHDYPSENRSTPTAASTVKAQRQNVQLQDRDLAAFTAFRKARDAKLDTPKLLYPSIQLNLAAGQMPAPEVADQRFLKLPIRVRP